MPGCEWRTKRPGEYVHVESELMQHLVSDHTMREMADVLISAWQWSSSGHRNEGTDPLSFIRDVAEPDNDPLPPPKKDVTRPHAVRPRGRKPRFEKTYAQMVITAFESASGGTLTTSQIQASMGTQAGAIIPDGSVCATLHKMRENKQVERVGPGQWKKHEAAK